MTKPFVKWVGGKRQLLPVLLEHMPKEDIHTYIEPFVGGGALLFSLKPEMFEKYEETYILASDINSELIYTYETIKYNVENLIKKLKTYHNDEQFYYTIRDLDRTDEYKKLSNLDKIARFLYLNKTCFNGLYRVNKKGQFNTPYGKYKNPCICDEDNLRACSKFLYNMDISFDVCSYDSYYSSHYYNSNTFVYLDPPYYPLNKTSNFTQYTKEGFNEESQVQLKQYCDFINSSGGKFMLSNSDCDFINDLYKDYEIIKVYAKRSINSKGDSRQKITEVLVKNY